MPKKLERCVSKVRKQGKDKSSAYAICNASIKEEQMIKDHSTFDNADIEEACMYIKKAQARLNACEKQEVKPIAVKLDILCQQLKQIIG